MIEKVVWSDVLNGGQVSQQGEQHPLRYLSTHTQRETLVLGDGTSTVGYTKPGAPPSGHISKYPLGIFFNRFESQWINIIQTKCSEVKLLFDNQNQLRFALPLTNNSCMWVFFSEKHIPFLNVYNTYFISGIKYLSNQPWLRCKHVCCTVYVIKANKIERCESPVHCHHLQPPHNPRYGGVCEPLPARGTYPRVSPKPPGVPVGSWRSQCAPSPYNLGPDLPSVRPSVRPSSSSLS